MNKPSSRLNQLPQPLMLSRKIGGNSSDLQKPYRLGSQQVSQKPGLLSDMKQELSLIKDGVQKLLVTNDQQGPSLVISSVPEMVNQTLKQQLVQHKQLEERLRKQLQKTKNDHLTSMQNAREAFDRRLQLVRKQHKQEKSNFKGKIFKLQQTIQLLQQNLTRKNEQVSELKKIIQTNMAENEGALKLFELKYQSSISEFKKLELRFSESQKGDLATVQHRLYEIQNQCSTLKVQNIALKNDLSYGSGKLQRLSTQFNEIKARNLELEDRVRIHIKNQEYQKQIQELKNSLNQLEIQKTFLSQNLTEKTKQYEHVMRQLQQSNDSNLENQQLHNQRLQIVNLQVQINQLKQKNIVLINQVQYLREVLGQKQSYIQALQDQTSFIQTSSVIKSLQDRCQALNQEKIKIVKDYQQAISTLQNNNQKSILKNASNLNTSRINRNPSFDEALKEQIRQCDNLRFNLREKSQEIISLKLLVEELQRRSDALKNQFESQKIKLISEQKSNSKNLQYNYQCTKQQLQLIKRKEETMQKKLQMRADQLKKKDQFIQKHLIGKIGKDQNQTDTQYLAEQLQKFMSLRIQQSSVIFEQIPKLDTPRMYKHPQLLKNGSILISSIVKE